MLRCSFIVTIYNTEKYLKKCLQSIKNITAPIEVILIDDGSDDECGAICEEYAAEDNRFKVIHQENKGLVEARKTGINAVTYGYFTFVDSDDYIDATAYDTLFSSLVDNKNTVVDIYCLGMMEEFRGSTSLKVNKYANGVYSGAGLKKIINHMLSYGDFFDFGILPNTVSKIYRTEFVKKGSFHVSPDVTIGEDADMIFQLLVQANTVCVMNEAAYHYCRREDSMMWRKVEYESINSLENDLKNTFKKSNNNRLMEQLNDYMDFIKLICAPEMVLSELDFFKSNNERIALYGAGGVGKAVRNSLRNNFTLWVDNNSDYYHSDLISPVCKLMECYDQYDKVFIAISNVNTCREIKQNLVKMGIEKPICYYRMTIGESS